MKNAKICDLNFCILIVYIIKRISAESDFEYAAS